MKGKITLVTLGALILISVSVQANQQSFKFDMSTFDTINIVHASGQIRVANTIDPVMAELKVLNPVSSKDCSFKYEIKDRTLFLTTEKKIFTIKSDCSQDLELFVAQNKKIKGSLGQGRFVFNGIFPKITAELGSGDIQIQGKVANLDLNVATGSVTVAGLDGYGKITLLSGDIDVKYDQPENKLNQLFVSKTVGNTNIQIPKGAKAESKLKTLLGHITNKIKPSTSGQFYFSVKTNVGDISMDTY